MHLTQRDIDNDPKLRAAIDAADELALKKRKNAEPELDGVSEKEVVSEIITALRLRGYCAPREWKPGAKGIFIRVGQRKAAGSGTDEGCPDLMVYKYNDNWPVDDGYPKWLKYDLEIKARTKGARLSKEQTTLKALGIIHIVNSAEQVLSLLDH